MLVNMSMSLFFIDFHWFSLIFIDDYDDNDGDIRETARKLQAGKKNQTRRRRRNRATAAKARELGNTSEDIAERY